MMLPSYKEILALIFCILVMHPRPVGARNLFLLISSGVTPTNNHYSQYLQTKTLQGYLNSRFGAGNVDTYYSAGNTGARRILPDVHMRLSPEEGKRDKMIYGVLPENLPATHELIDDYFKKGPASRLAPNDKLFLFVNGHGMPNQNDENFDNNCIHLWSYDPKTKGRVSWDKQCLSREELGKLITDNVRAEKTVFSMSQCFSGGFHKMSVDSSGPYPSANPNLCGFTSALPDMEASGCTDDVEADHYAGYERYFTEQLSGRDVLTGSRSGRKPKKTIWDAHRAALAQDKTIDIPMGTSDYYLSEWYWAIWRKNFKPRTSALSSKEVVKLADETVSLRHDPVAHAKSPALKSAMERILTELKQVSQLLSGSDAELERLLSRGSEKELDTAADRYENIISKSGAAYSRLDRESFRLRHDSIYTAWNRALRRNETAGLTPEEVEEFELGYMAKIEENLRHDEDIARVRLPLFAIRALTQYTQQDPAKAERFSRYFAKRENLMMTWASAQKEPEMAAALRRYYDLDKKLDKLDAVLVKADKLSVYVKRILELRRQLAAAAVLDSMRDQAAINDYSALVTCEKTAF